MGKGRPPILQKPYQTVLTRLRPWNQMNAVIAPIPVRLDFMDPVRESVIAGLQAYIAPVDKPVVVYFDNQVRVGPRRLQKRHDLTRLFPGRTPKTFG